jgi:hypothetical protein
LFILTKQNYVTITQAMAKLRLELAPALLHRGEALATEFSREV